MDRFLADLFRELILSKLETDQTEKLNGIKLIIF